MMQVMPRISFTQNLQRHVACPSAEVPGGTVREVLEAFFADYPDVRGYVLDEQGAVRHHMVIFVDGRPIRDRLSLSDPVPPGSEVYVFQALSGG
jgi:molybdopterin synthase sulfur carrier subunit